MNLKMGHHGNDIMSQYLIQFAYNTSIFRTSRDRIVEAGSKNEAIFIFANDYLNGLETRFRWSDSKPHQVGIGMPEWLRDADGQPVAYDPNENYHKKFMAHMGEMLKNAASPSDGGFIHVTACEGSTDASALLVLMSFKEVITEGRRMEVRPLGAEVKAYDVLLPHAAMADMLEDMRSRAPEMFKQRIRMIDAIKDAATPAHARGAIERNALAHDNHTAQVTLFIKDSPHSKHYIRLPETAAIGKCTLRSINDKEEYNMYFITATHAHEHTDLGIGELVEAATSEIAYGIVRSRDERLEAPHAAGITRVWGVDDSSKAITVCIISALVPANGGYRHVSVGQAAANLDLRKLVEAAYRGLKEEYPDALLCDSESIIGKFDGCTHLEGIKGAFLEQMAAQGSSFTTILYIRTNVDGPYAKLPKNVFLDAYLPNYGRAVDSSSGVADSSPSWLVEYIPQPQQKQTN